MKMKIHFLLSVALVCATNALAQKTITNELIWASPEFNSEYIDGLSSLNDGLHYTSIEQSDFFGNRIVKYSYETGEQVGTIASSIDIYKDAEKPIEGYEFSADEKLLLLPTEMTPIYRYSYSAHYYVSH